MMTLKLKDLKMFKSCFWLIGDRIGLRRKGRMESQGPGIMLAISVSVAGEEDLAGGRYGLFSKEQPKPSLRS